MVLNAHVLKGSLELMAVVLLAQLACSTIALPKLVKTFVDRTKLSMELNAYVDKTFSE